MDATVSVGIDSMLDNSSKFLSDQFVYECVEQEGAESDTLLV